MSEDNDEVRSLAPIAAASFLWKGVVAEQKDIAESGTGVSIKLQSSASLKFIRS